MATSSSFRCAATAFPRPLPRTPTSRAQAPAISIGKRSPNFRRSSVLQSSISSHGRAAETHPRREFATHASNNNAPDGTSARDKDDSNSPSTGNSGPPLLTILAGAVVFLLFCFVVGSILMWLVGLIIHPPSG